MNNELYNDFEKLAKKHAINVKGIRKSDDGSFQVSFEISEELTEAQLNEISAGTASTNPRAGYYGKVICTELTRMGLIERELWLASVKFGAQNYSQTMMTGYHLWGVPYVQLMRRHAFFAHLARPFVNALVVDIAHSMGIRQNGSMAGKLFRHLVWKPVNTILGMGVECAQKLQNFGKLIG